MQPVGKNRISFVYQFNFFPALNLHGLANEWKTNNPCGINLQGVILYNYIKHTSIMFHSIKTMTMLIPKKGHFILYPPLPPLTRFFEGLWKPFVRWLLFYEYFWGDSGDYRKLRLLGRGWGRYHSIRTLTSWGNFWWPICVDLHDEFWHTVLYQYHGMTPNWLVGNYFPSCMLQITVPAYDLNVDIWLMD